MLKPIAPQKKIERLHSLIDSANKIVLTAHISPDGDAIGSTLAMRDLLEGMGKQVHVVTPDAPPESLMFIPGAKEIIAYCRHVDFSKKLFDEADLIFGMDFNAPYRVDRLSPLLMSAKAPKVLFDHHINPEKFCDLEFSYPGECSTCMLTFRLICQLGWLERLSKKAATAICTGMMTDTGNFTYSAQDPDIYIVLAELMKKGVDKQRIYILAFNTKSENILRLEAYALDNKLTVYHDKRAAVITLTLDELNRFKYKPGDTEGLVNMPLAIPDVLYVAFFREGPDYIKVSCRSEGDIPVNILCTEYYGGGGHKNAAGGEFKGTMDEALTIFDKAMTEFTKYLPSDKK